MIREKATLMLTYITTALLPADIVLCVNCCVPSGAQKSTVLSVGSSLVPINTQTGQWISLFKRYNPNIIVTYAAGSVRQAQLAGKHADYSVCLDTPPGKAVVATKNSIQRSLPRLQQPSTLNDSPLGILVTSYLPTFTTINRAVGEAGFYLEPCYYN